MGTLHRRNRKIDQAIVGLVFCTSLAFGATPAQTDPPKDTQKVEQILKQSIGKSTFEAEFQTLVNMGTAVVPEMVKSFKDPSKPWESRWVCAQVLGHFNTQESFEALKSGAQDQLFLIRLASLKGLQKNDSPEVSKIIESLISDKALVVRSEAALILGERKETHALEALGKELFEQRNFHRGKSLWSRQNMIRAMGNIGSAQALPTLLKTLQESETEIRLESCQALSLIEPTAVTSNAVGDKCWEAWLTWDQCQKNPKSCATKAVQTVGRPSI